MRRTKWCSRGDETTLLLSCSQKIIAFIYNLNGLVRSRKEMLCGSWHQPQKLSLRILGRLSWVAHSSLTELSDSTPYPSKRSNICWENIFSIFPWSLTFTTRFSRIPHKTLAYRWTCYADYNFLETGSYWRFGTQHIVILIKCQVQCLKHVSDIGQKLPWCDQDCCHLMYYRNKERNMSCVKMITLENLL